MMDTVQGIFHVANISVEPLEHFAIIVLPSGRGDNRLMSALVSYDSRKTIQTIRDYMAFRPEMLCTPDGDFILGEAAEVTEVEIQESGICRYTHMTSREIRPGRSLSRTTAKNRHGLEKEPEKVMKIKIPQGHPVRKDKVVGGRPGYGEITSPRLLPPKNIVDVRSIPPKKGMVQ